VQRSARRADEKSCIGAKKSIRRNLPDRMVRMELQRHRAVAGHSLCALSRRDGSIDDQRSVQSFVARPLILMSIIILLHHPRSESSAAHRRVAPPPPPRSISLRAERRNDRNAATSRPQCAAGWAAAADDAVCTCSIVDPCASLTLVQLHLVATSVDSDERSGGMRTAGLTHQTRDQRRRGMIGAITTD